MEDDEGKPIVWTDPQILFLIMLFGLGLIAFFNIIVVFFVIVIFNL